MYTEPQSSVCDFVLCYTHGAIGNFEWKWNFKWLRQFKHNCHLITKSLRSSGDHCKNCRCLCKKRGPLHFSIAQLIDFFDAYKFRISFRLGDLEFEWAAASAITNFCLRKSNHLISAANFFWFLWFFSNSRLVLQIIFEQVKCKNSEFSSVYSLRLFSWKMYGKAAQIFS